MNPPRHSLDLNLLRYLLAIQEAGTVEGAAGRLNVSTATVYSAVAHLRLSFARPLFERRAGKLHTTPYCDRLCDHISHVLALLDSGLEMIGGEHVCVLPTASRRPASTANR